MKLLPQPLLLLLLLFLLPLFRLLLPPSSRVPASLNLPTKPIPHYPSSQATPTSKPIVPADPPPKTIPCPLRQPSPPPQLTTSPPSPLLVRPPRPCRPGHPDLLVPTPSPPPPSALPSLGRPPSPASPMIPSLRTNARDFLRAQLQAPPTSIPASPSPPAIRHRRPRDLTPTSKLHRPSYTLHHRHSRFQHPPTTSPSPSLKHPCSPRRNPELPEPPSALLPHLPPRPPLPLSPPSSPSPSPSGPSRFVRARSLMQPART